jgi:hypothetical protein
MENRMSEQTIALTNVQLNVWKQDSGWRAESPDVDGLSGSGPSAGLATLDLSSRARRIVNSLKEEMATGRQLSFRTQEQMCALQALFGDDQAKGESRASEHRDE